MPRVNPTDRAGWITINHSGVSRLDSSYRRGLNLQKNILNLNIEAFIFKTLRWDGKQYQSYTTLGLDLVSSRKLH